MARADVQEFFGEYVRWMKRDIGREVEWFETTGQDAGNMLCAVGLLIWTEALGRVLRWNFDRAAFCDGDGREIPQPKRNFDAMFDRLNGGEYGRWRREWELEHFDTSIYEVLRSGMVHEFRPKVPAVFYMDAKQPRGVDWRPPRLWFFVIPYFRHFGAAADELYDELMSRGSEPSLPEAHFVNGPNAIYAGPVVGTLPLVSGMATAVVTPTSSVASGGDYRFMEQLRRSDEDRKR